MRRLFLSVAVLAMSHVQVFAGGEPPQSPADLAAEVLIKDLEARALYGDGLAPRFFIFAAGQQDVPIEILVYDADGNLQKTRSMPVPCAPSQNSCPFDRTGLTPEETTEFFNQRELPAIFSEGFEARDWSAFSTDN